MATPPAQTLSTAIGGVMRALRESAGLRQEDVAAEARGLALAWTFATVAALETGRRQLRPEELVLLPRVLRRAGIQVTLPQLLGDSAIRLSPTVVDDADAIRHEFEGDPDDAGHKWTATVAGDSLAGSGPSQYGTDLRMINEARDDAVLKAARLLDVDPVHLARTAHSLWGRSLVSERDHRIGGFTGRALQAKRGHITRALVAELRSALKTGKRMRRPK
jgi:transcriptional regulator with XRE-family HTH domain